MRKPAIPAIVAVAAACLTLGTALSGAQESDDSGDANSTLRIGEVNFPSDLNPFTSFEIAPAYNLSLNYDFTVNASPENLSAVPGVVETFEQSADGKTTTYTLADGLNWSDGQPVTADDVVWAYEVLAKAPLFSFDYGNVTDVEAVNESTVEITTSKAAPVLAESQFLYILPEHVWGKVPEEELNSTYQPELPAVGTGPFVITEIDSDQIVMQRNSEYRGDPPGFDELRFIKFGNADALQRALSAGEIDLIFGDGARSIPTNFDTPIETSRGLTSGWAEFSFNSCEPAVCPDAKRNPAVADPAFRLALAYALDLDAIVDTATEGQGFKTQGQGFIGPFYETWDQPVEPAYEHDPEKAGQMLDAAGWKLGSDGVREKNGTKAELRILVPAERQAYRDAASFIADQARDVGIEFTVETIAEARLFEAFISEVDGQLAPDFDTMIYPNLGGAYDPSIMLAVYGSVGLGAFNTSGFADAKYDRLYEQQLSETDVDARKAIVNKMESIVQEQAPAIPLWYEPTLGAWNGDIVEGLEPAYPRPDGAILSFLGYEPLANAQPGSGGDSGASSTWIWVLVAAAAAVGAIALLVRRGRRGSEKLEE